MSADGHRDARVLFVAPHAVPYHVGLYRALSNDRCVAQYEVAYCDRMGSLTEFYDREFCVQRQTSADLLIGYKSYFVRNFVRPANAGFLSRLNPTLMFNVGSYDAVVLFGMGVISYWFAFFGAVFAGRAVFIKGEATPELYQGLSPIRKRLRIWLYRRVLSRCATVFYSCRGNREFWKLHGVPDDKLRFLPCAVDNAFFGEQAIAWQGRAKETREELSISPDSLVIVSVARFTSRKRPVDLIRAVGDMARDDRERVVLLFVGGGPEEDQMDEAARAAEVQIHCVPYTEESGIGKFYACADACAVLSEYDPSPKTINEAMNFSLPVLVTEVVGTAGDLVVNGRNGYIVDVGDLKAVAEHLTRMVKDRSLCRRLGAAAKQDVETWSFERGAAAVEAAVAQVVNRRVLVAPDVGGCDRHAEESSDDEKPAGGCT